MRYEDMLAECESCRGEDGFCGCCTSCSGPAPSNLACDYPLPEGAEAIYRGGRYGSCRFVIDGKPKAPEPNPTAWDLDELDELLARL